MQVAFITNRLGIQPQHREVGEPLPEWCVVEARHMGGKLEDGLWHYKRLRRVAPGTGGADEYYYQFDHAQQV
jgi:hypothetical protein